MRLKNDPKAAELMAMKEPIEEEISPFSGLSD